MNRLSFQPDRQSTSDRPNLTGKGPTIFRKMSDPFADRQKTDGGQQDPARNRVL